MMDEHLSLEDASRAVARRSLPHSVWTRLDRLPAAVAFGTTIGVSAFLLFTVQPLVGRLVLPVYGGAVAVWATILVFFQTVLLLGYLYAHLVTVRLSPLAGALLHVVVIGGALVATAAVPRDIAVLNDPSLPTISGLLAMLLLLVGPAAFAMTATTPLVSAWYARTRAATDPNADPRDPYWLYALSNGGSLASLLAYPLLIEPHLGLSVQRQAWLLGFAVLVGLIVLSAARLRAGIGQALAAGGHTVETLRGVRPVLDAADHLTWRRRIRWLALAAIPAGLLSAVTNFVTTDLISAPLLWVVPLAVYLASFVVAFSDRGRRALPWIIATAPAALTLLWIPLGSSGGWPILPILLVEYPGLAAVATALHGRLAEDRPTAHHLTEFYLTMSAGGALGGAFVAIVAPLAFDGVWEYPILIVAAFAALAATSPKAGAQRPIRALTIGAPVRLGAFLVVAVPLLALMGAEGSLGFAAASRWVLVGAVILAFGGVARFLALATGVVLFMATIVLPPAAVFRDRSFYGVTEVLQTDEALLLMHGTTVHGMEWADPARRVDPGSYYARSGPVGDLFAAFGTRAPGRIRVLGLGAGVLAAYARPEDDLVFYEIDPLVARVAQDPGYFTYLPSRVPPAEIRIGDGRVLLAEEASDSLDLVVMDAFSSDAVPVHLITVEALLDADRALRSDGILAVHVSNRYYDLGPPVTRAMESLGLTVLERQYVPTPDEAARGAGLAHFVVGTRDRTTLRLLEARGWVPSRNESAPLSDDFSDLLGHLR